MMDLEISESSGVTVVAPKGELDLAVGDGLRRTLTDLIDTGRRRLVMDLGGVAYVDSSGLGALVAAMKHARTVGGDIKLCALQPTVHSVFKVTRLVKIMDVYPTRQDALASWG